jgi:hypothetical protein
VARVEDRVDGNRNCIVILVHKHGSNISPLWFLYGSTPNLKGDFSNHPKFGFQTQSDFMKALIKGVKNHPTDVPKVVYFPRYRHLKFFKIVTPRPEFSCCLPLFFCEVDDARRQRSDELILLYE